MCDFALELGCPSLNLWPGQDGCDYLLCDDYDTQRAWMCEAIKTSRFLRQALLGS